MNTDIPTNSPINGNILRGQNQRLYEWLKEGHTIHCFHPAKMHLRIGYLNSRCADLVKVGIQLYKRYIHVKNSFGDDTSVIEYSLYPFKN